MFSKSVAPTITKSDSVERPLEPEKKVEASKETVKETKSLFDKPAAGNLFGKKTETEDKKEEKKPDSLFGKPDPKDRETSN